MRKLLLFSLLFCTVCRAENTTGDRPLMVPQPERDAVKILLDRVSESCSSRDFIVFMSCFTPKKAKSVRSKAEDAFIRGPVDMEVLDFFVISSDDCQVSFGVRYYWDDKLSGKTMFCSKVMAKKSEDGLLIDSEQVREARPTTPQRTQVAQANCRKGTCDVGQPQGGWRHPDPANGGEEAWLPKDILYMPGPSCANGNCGVR